MFIPSCRDSTWPGCWPAAVTHSCRRFANCVLSHTVAQELAAKLGCKFLHSQFVRILRGSSRSLVDLRFLQVGLLRGGMLAAGGCGCRHGHECDSERAAGPLLHLASGLTTAYRYQDLATQPGNLAMQPGPGTLYGLANDASLLGWSRKWALWMLENKASPASLSPDHADHFIGAGSIYFVTP